MNRVPRRDAPAWKLYTLYEGAMRFPCLNSTHKIAPCDKCGVAFLLNNVPYFATYAEIVAARDPRPSIAEVLDGQGDT
jgi:hypothetical protein